MPVQRHELDPKAVANVLMDSGTFGTVLHALALICYGEEIYHLDPIELYHRLEEDWRTKLTEEGESKLQAMLMAVSTNLFYEDPEAFRGICEALATGDPDAELMGQLELPVAFWGVWEVEANREAGTLSPAIHALVDGIMGDSRDEGDEPFAHVSTYLEEQLGHLKHQLESLGLPTQDLPPLNPAKVASLALQ